jgi:SGNH hydrolase-like domain, acetyltransferase AlgX
MAPRTERVVRVLFGIGWLGGLAAGMTLAATAGQTTPLQLGGLLVVAYLAVWGLYFFPSRQRLAGHAGRFLACTFSIVVALAVLELGGHFAGVDYRRVFLSPSEPWERPGNRPDPALLYVRKGGQHILRRITGNEVGALGGARSAQVYRCDMQYDQDGFRNPHPASAAGVIVLGDSFIEGSHVSDAEVVTSQLEGLLSRPVANLGRSGDGPQQELEVLRRYGLALRPQTCVWSFYEGNDLIDSQRFEGKQAEVRRYSQQSRLQSWSQRSFTRNCLDYAIRNWLNPAPRPPAALYTGKFIDSRKVPVDISFGSEDHYDAHSPGGVRDHSPELRRVAAVLAKAHELCRRLGIDLVVVFIPTKFRVYRDLCRFEPDSPCLAWPVDGVPGELGKLVASISTAIGYIDLTPSFQTEAANGSLVYLQDDTHWSGAGHALAAHAIREYLKARPALRRPTIADRAQNAGISR